jgi:hypothetical protein
VFTLSNFSDTFLIKWQIPHYYRSATELAFYDIGKDQELLILPMHVCSLIVRMELKYFRKAHKLLVGTHSDLAEYQQKQY